MRRANDDVVAVGRARLLTWFTALVFVATAMATTARAGEPASEPARVDRVGQRVVARSGGRRCGSNDENPTFPAVR